MNTLFFRRAALVALVLTAFAMPRIGMAQRLISYQGILTDANGIGLMGTHVMTFHIYAQDTGGTPVFEETQKVPLNAGGEFNVLIGSIFTLPSLPVVNPDKDRYYLGISIDGATELSPRSPISDVARAFFADTAGWARNTASALVSSTALRADTALFASSTTYATYADTASYARTSVPVTPTTVNGIAPTVLIAGSGGISVANLGNTITISSQETVTGIDTLGSLDGTIIIMSPTGPTTQIGIVDSSLTTRKLAGGAVTNAKLASNSVSNFNLIAASVTNDKISSGSAAASQVLAANGTGGALWQSVVATTLQLPYIGTASATGSTFGLTNTGTGGALSTASGANTIVSSTNSSTGIAIEGITSDGGAGVQVNSGVVGTSLSGSGVSGLSSSGDGVYASNSATGNALHAVTTSSATTAHAGYFENLSTSTSGNVLESHALGTGMAGYFQIANTASNANTLEAVTNSSGGSAAALFGWATNSSGGSYGVWGQAEGSGADAIYGLSNNTSGNGAGVYGWSRGSTGIGVYGKSDGTATGTIGVEGLTTNTTATSGTFIGTQGICNTPSTNGYGLYGSAVSPGIGVYGTTSGAGSGMFGTNSSAAGFGIEGQNTAGGTAIFGLTSGSNYAVEGENTASTGIGILGYVPSSTGYGVYGYNGGGGSGVFGYGGIGVQGLTNNVNGYGVLGNANSGSGLGVFGTTGSTSASGTGVYALVGGTSPTSIGTSNALIANYGGSGTSSTTANNIAIFTSGSTREFRFANNGQAYTISGGAWNSGGADLAEAFDVVGSKSEYEPGDVLVLSPTAVYHVAKCTTPYSPCVAGVYATSPGVILGFDGVNGDTATNAVKVPMGVIGVLPTHVSSENGPIAVGDLLVTSSTSGCAMKGDPDKIHFGTILGKAMEPFTASGTGTIKVLVGKY